LLIKVKVEPKSRKEEIIKKKDSFLIKVKEKPERGLVNKRIVELLSLHFNSGVRIIKGHKTKNKIIEVCLK